MRQRLLARFALVATLCCAVARSFAAEPSATTLARQSLDECEAGRQAGERAERERHFDRGRRSQSARSRLDDRVRRRPLRPLLQPGRADAPRRRVDPRRCSRSASLMHELDRTLELEPDHADALVRQGHAARSVCRGCSAATSTAGEAMLHRVIDARPDGGQRAPEPRAGVRVAAASATRASRTRGARSRSRSEQGRADKIAEAQAMLAKLGARPLIARAIRWRRRSRPRRAHRARRARERPSSTSSSSAAASPAPASHATRRCAGSASALVEAHRLRGRHEQPQLEADPRRRPLPRSRATSRSCARRRPSGGAAPDRAASRRVAAAWSCRPTGAATQLKLAAGLWTFEKLATVDADERHRMLEPRRGAGGRAARSSPDRLHGAAAFTEYLTDDARLVLDERASARTGAGALVANHAEVTRARAAARDRRARRALGGDRASRPRARRRERRRSVGGRGPSGGRVPQGGRRLQLTKGIHLVVPHARLPVRHSVVMTARDKRSVFVVPRDDIDLHRHHRHLLSPRRR